jgi:hypothetical protein
MQGQKESRWGSAAFGRRSLKFRGSADPRNEKGGEAEPSKKPDGFFSSSRSDESETFVEKVEEEKTRGVFEPFGTRRFEEVHQDFENEKGGKAEPSKNSYEFFSSSWF